jgi:hypothetical protein
LWASNGRACMHSHLLLRRSGSSSNRRDKFTFMSCILWYTRELKQKSKLS